MLLVETLKRKQLPGIGKTLYPEDFLRFIEAGHDLKSVIIDTEDPVNLGNKSFVKLPYTFGITDNFLCDNNLLDSLKGCPDKVAGEFICNSNKLTSLKGGPTHVGFDYEAKFNKIDTLEGFPAYVGSAFSLNDNRLTSLVGIHKHLKACRTIWLGTNPIKEGGIGLIFVEHLSSITIGKSNSEAYLAMKIISKYLKQGKSGLLACATELEEAGLGEFAKL